MRMSTIGFLSCFCFFASNAVAHTIGVTMYDDGLSCPGNCDAHVVLNQGDNGSSHAFAVGSTAESPQPCRSGQICNICFDHSTESCLQVMYRGSGPPAGKFDFTPTFFAETCGQAGIPAALLRHCGHLDNMVVSRGYTTRANCFATPDHPSCGTVMTAAEQRKEVDSELRKQCLEMGQNTFNVAQNDPNMRRTHACNYSHLSLGGPNSNGDRWKMLLPGACRSGTYVGRDGLDCCSGDIRFAASIHPECTPYFPKN